MKNKLLLFVFILSLTACRKENRFDCFKGNGKRVTEERSLPAFSEIHLEDKFETRVVQSPESRVVVSCGERIIKNIRTEVVKGILSITNHNTCNFVRGYKEPVIITIYTPFVSYLVNDAVGAVEFDEQFRQDSINVRVASSGDVHLRGTFRVIRSSSNGNGDMYISGVTEILFLYTNGINFVNTLGLSVSNYMFIHSVTIGDCYINAADTRQFDYNIQGRGNIYYSGTPAVINNYSDPSGTGQLFKK
jgi:hypothetical protein